jgi:hypothetical protein
VLITLLPVAAFALVVKYHVLLLGVNHHSVGLEPVSHSLRIGHETVDHLLALLVVIRKYQIINVIPKGGMVGDKVQGPKEGLQNENRKPTTRHEPASTRRAVRMRRVHQNNANTCVLREHHVKKGGWGS